MKRMSRSRQPRTQLGRWFLAILIATQSAPALGGSPGRPYGRSRMERSATSASVSTATPAVVDTIRTAPQASEESVGAIASETLAQSKTPPRPVRVKRTYARIKPVSHGSDRPVRPEQTQAIGFIPTLRSEIRRAAQDDAVSSHAVTTDFDISASESSSLEMVAGTSGESKTPPRPVRVKRTYARIKPVSHRSDRPVRPARTQAIGVIPSLRSGIRPVGHDAAVSSQAVFADFTLAPHEGVQEMFPTENRVEAPAIAISQSGSNTPASHQNAAPSRFGQSRLQRSTKTARTPADLDNASPTTSSKTSAPSFALSRMQQTLAMTQIAGSVATTNAPEKREQPAVVAAAYQPDAIPSLPGELTPESTDDSSPMPQAPTAPSDPMIPAAPVAPPTPSAPVESQLASAQGARLSAFAPVGGTESAAATANPGAPANVVGAGSSAIGAAAASTGELASQATSVSLRRTSAVNLDPQIRGFNTNQIGAGINGVSQYKTRIDIDSMFSQIPAGLVENITVFDGPYTSMYGPGFAFMAAEFIPTRYYDCPEHHARLSMGQDTNSAAFLTRTTAWGGSQDYSYVASYGLRTAADYYSGDDFNIPAQYQAWDGFFAGGVKLTERTRVEGFYLHPEFNTLELPGVVYDIVNSTNDQATLRYVVKDEADGMDRFVAQYYYGYTGYSGNSTRTSKQSTFFQPFVANAFPTATVNAAGATVPLAPSPITNLFATGSLIWSGASSYIILGEEDCTQIYLGADWRQQRINYSEYDVNAAGDNFFTSFFNGNLSVGNSIFGIPPSTINDWGVFANVVIPTTDWLDVTVGGRVDYYQAQIAASIPPSIAPVAPYADVSPVAGTNDPSQVLGMGYGTAKIALTESMSLTAGTGFGMRGPQLAELYSNSPIVPLYRFGNSTAVGNSNLDPEQNLQFDLGVTGDWEFVRMGVRGFNSNVYNYILPVPIGLTVASTTPDFSLGRQLGNGLRIGNYESVEYQYDNVGRALIYGCDMFGEVRVLPWMSLVGSTAYVKGTNYNARQYGVLFPAGSDVLTPGSYSVLDLGPKGSAEGLPGIYPWTGTIGVRLYQPETERWGIEFLSRMTMDQNFVADSLGELPSTGFTVFDLRGYWFVRESVRLTCSLENLLNRQYSEIGALAMANPSDLSQVIFVPQMGFNAIFGVEIGY